jgi:hypothetical protein
LQGLILQNHVQFLEMKLCGEPTLGERNVAARDSTEVMYIGPEFGAAEQALRCAIMSEPAANSSDGEDGANTERTNRTTIRGKNVLGPHPHA